MTRGIQLIKYHCWERDRSWSEISKSISIGLCKSKKNKSETLFVLFIYQKWKNKSNHEFFHRERDLYWNSNSFVSYNLIETLIQMSKQFEL